MRHLSAPPLLLLSALALGCEEPIPDTPQDDPCDPVWGVAPATGRLHVDAAAEGGADGSLEAPFQSLAAALEASRAGGERQIVLAAGTYSGGIALEEPAGDEGLEIAGCGRAETFLEEEGNVPNVRIRNELTDGVVIRDLALTGGLRGIIIRDGAGAESPIRVERVDIRNVTRIGILVDGAATVAKIHDVLVSDIEPQDGIGWGISVQAARPLGTGFPALTELWDVEVSGAQGLGILVDGGGVDVRDTRVTGVNFAPGDTLGRGLQLQNWSQGMLDAVESFGNSDAAVFLESPARPDPEDPGGPLVPIELLGCSLGPTSAASIPGEQDEAADGLTIVQRTQPEPYPADTFRVVLDDTEFAENSRAHVLAEGISLEMGSNNVFGKGTSFPLASQRGAVVTGIGGGASPEAPVELGDGEELPINRGVAGLDDPDA